MSEEIERDQPKDQQRESLDRPLTLDRMLGCCDLRAPEPEDIGSWLDMLPVGREFGAKKLK